MRLELSFINGACVIPSRDIVFGFPYLLTMTVGVFTLTMRNGLVIMFRLKRIELLLQ